MATLDFTDSPIGEAFVSVYKPIKLLARLDGETDKTLFPSAIFRITPYNIITNEFDYDREVQIRVPVMPKVPNIASDQYANTGCLNYAIDVSSICRDLVSFDLRPCTQETQHYIHALDMTSSSLSVNTYTRVSVRVRVEKMVDGVLTEQTNPTDTVQFYPINAALSNEEEHSYMIERTVFNANYAGTTAFESQGQEFDLRFKHLPDAAQENGVQKYLTIKPTKQRWIGEDESEYITFIVAQDGSGDKVYVQIKFFDLDGNVITDKSGSNYRLNLFKNASGTGSYRPNILSHTSSDHTDETKGVVQVGIGTRNIKNTDRVVVGHDNGFVGIANFRGISKYTVRTLSAENNEPIGELITYYIDHSKTNSGKTRFHWQNRLGGIDSYTFEDTMVKGITTSSSTFEKSIYPDFNAQIGGSTASTTFTGSFGNQRNRQGGNTSDTFHSVSKSKVKAYKEGSAISRPIDRSEEEMFEDLMSSPRVWIEGGWKSREVFYDDFNYATIYDAAANWTALNVDRNFILEPSSDNPSVISGKALKIGDGGSDSDADFFYSEQLIAYDPTKLYEIEVRFKQNAGTGTVFAGFVGFAADKTTRISTLGTDVASNAHYVAASDWDDVDGAEHDRDEYVTLRGYVTGYDNNGLTEAGGQHNDPNDPAKAHTGIKYIAAQFLANYSGEAGIVVLDYMKITEHEPDISNSRSYYSTLNRHYYIPVVIKDGGTTLHDSNGLTKVTVDYIHSKEQKTIR